MAIELHTFDPKGDLLLILSKAVVHDPESKTGAAVENTPTGSATPEGDGDAVSTGSLATAVQAVADGENTGNETSEDTVIQGEIVESDATAEAEKPAIVVHMLVSSKHMMLASPFFKAMLKGGVFKEGRKLKSNGKVEVPLPDDNPDHFRAILDIIHGRNRQVPRTMDLVSLVEVSILVDNYQKAEAVESFSGG